MTPSTAAKAAVCADASSARSSAVRASPGARLPAIEMSESFRSPACVYKQTCLFVGGDLVGSKESLLTAPMMLQPCQFIQLPPVQTDGATDTQYNEDYFQYKMLKWVCSNAYDIRSGSCSEALIVHAHFLAPGAPEAPRWRCAPWYPPPFHRPRRARRCDRQLCTLTANTAFQALERALQR